MSKSNKLHLSGGSMLANEHLEPEGQTGDRGRAGESATRLTVGSSFEPESPMPAQLSRLEHPGASDSFRNFGINE